ncbi:hypothetical protein I79_004895 [Cricetulus griseus]|uniref:Uncharacterized protein n=1 Tax=Cricetulus griseus TaxID=10029 RepID=G3H3R7_CRIGR|nr:hypothetical protein I79_004895 [Cricetulus griseus]
MALNCLSFSSLTHSLFCISSWVAATRRSYGDQWKITIYFTTLHKHTTHLKLTVLYFFQN